jgi:hypothetical protein
MAFAALHRQSGEDLLRSDAGVSWNARLQDFAPIKKRIVDFNRRLHLVILAIDRN